MKYKAAMLLTAAFFTAAGLFLGSLGMKSEASSYLSYVPLFEADAYNQFAFDQKITTGGPGKETAVRHVTGTYACQGDISRTWDLSGTSYTESWESDSLRYENREGTWVEKEPSPDIPLSSLLNDRDTNLTVTKEKDAILVSWDVENKKITAVLDETLTLSHLTVISSVSRENSSGSIYTLTLVWTEQNNKEETLVFPSF